MNRLFPNLIFLALLGVVSLLFTRLISAFLIDILLAVIFTHQFQRVFLFFSKKLRLNLSVSASITLTIVVFIVIIPVITIGVMVSNQATQSIRLVMENWSSIKPMISMDLIETDIFNLPAFENFETHFENFKFQERINEGITKSVNISIDLIKGFFFNINALLLHFLLILFFMYFLLLESEVLKKKLQFLSPLDDRDEEELVKEVFKVADATLVGTFIIGIIEGAVGCMLFLLFQIPSAVFWACVMAILSIIPLVGTIFIYIPVGIYYILTGQVMLGSVFMILGVIASTIIQNLIKPKIVGNKGGLHPGLVLISTIGGIQMFGLVGFLVGPLIASLFVAVWNLFGKNYKDQLLAWNRGD